MFHTIPVCPAPARKTDTDAKPPPSPSAQTIFVSVLPGCRQSNPLIPPDNQPLPLQAQRHPLPASDGCSGYIAKEASAQQSETPAKLRRPDKVDKRRQRTASPCALAVAKRVLFPAHTLSAQVPARVPAPDRKSTPYKTMSLCSAAAVRHLAKPGAVPTQHLSKAALPPFFPVETQIRFPKSRPPEFPAPQAVQSAARTGFL